MNTVKLCTRWLSVFGSSLVLAACSASSPDEPEPSSASTTLGVEKAPQSVAELLALRGRYAKLGSEPGAEAHRKLTNAFRDGTTSRLKYSVYELAPARDSAVAAKQLGYAAGDSLVDANADSQGFQLKSFVNKNSHRRLDRNEETGYETEVDFQLHHSNTRGVPASELLGNTKYAQIAQDFHGRSGLGKVLPETVYVKKVSRFVNTVANALTKTESEPETYEVAVTLGFAIDDVPVIGSGSDVVVYLTPSGNVIGHATGMRRRTGTGPRFALTGADLKSPTDALQEAQSIAGRGYLAPTVEFGYFMQDKEQTQKLLAPSYLFTFEPMNPGNKRKRIEIAATKRADAAAAITADRQAARERLSRLHQSVKALE